MSIKYMIEYWGQCLGTVTQTPGRTLTFRMNGSTWRQQPQYVRAGMRAAVSELLKTPPQGRLDEVKDLDTGFAVIRLSDRTEY